MIDAINQRLKQLSQNPDIAKETHIKSHNLFRNGQAQLLTKSAKKFVFSVEDAFDDFEVVYLLEDGQFFQKCSCKAKEWCHHGIAGALQLQELLKKNEKQTADGKKYTRKGMIKRVLEERNLKAKTAEYSLVFTDNIYGEHLLHNETGHTYKLTLRDRKNHIGYCSCEDFKTNKLGTCKHLIYAFNQLDQGKRKMRNASKKYPFVEIYLNPLKNYEISWFYPEKLSPKIKALLGEYFKDDKTIRANKKNKFYLFLIKSEKFKKILIRKEVYDLLEKRNNKAILKKIEEDHKLDFSQLINAKLYPYQKKGVQFSTFKDAVIIADEMGLGKTLQAITTAIAKKQIFGFKKTLVVCPASVKDQWKKEVEKFSNESALVIEGKAEDRADQYLVEKHLFYIINYEVVLRDYLAINKGNFDFVILDEAQRIKNYSTITAQAIKRLHKKHAMVITGTPIENRLSDLYSIVQFLEPEMLSPLWEFSYQHCYFDEKIKNKIVGYYNLRSLKKRLKPILLRREKKDVIKDLPNVTQTTIPVEMSMEQLGYHNNFGRGIAKILSKKYISPYDMQKLMLLMSKMRMVCDSTFLIDKETNISPKLKELENILIDKMDIQNQAKKIIIFSEWITMNNLIGKMLQKHDITFTELNGKVPVSKRKKIIDRFFNDDDCKVFLSTEAGGTGLNLQIADTVINFELPWNPAKKNQRIGRIDRLGQLNKKLTVINLVTRNSIETKIMSGLALKQNLFEGVLSEKNDMDYVDFSSKGRAQFLQELQAAISEFDSLPDFDVTEDATTTEHESLSSIANAQKENQNGNSHTDSDGLKHAAKSSNALETMEPLEKAKIMEDALQQGMGFLSSLMKMATGKSLEMNDKSIQVDQETGEVVMRFKF